MASFFVENFGCRATQADGAAIERALQERGFASVARERADVVVVNTCTVTAAADSDARHTIRRIHRENPGCKILVTGCYAQRAPGEVASLPGVQWVVGNSHKSHVAELIGRSANGDHRHAGSSGPPAAESSGYLETPHFEQAQSGPSSDGFVSLSELSGQAHLPEAQVRLVGDIFAHTELMAAPVFEPGVNAAKTRPNLKVQDGCDNRCSFCVIPFVRGQSRSLSLSNVLQEVDSLVAAGYREIVVSGINLGRWGRDFAPQSRFEDLVIAILRETSLQRLRISSVEPMDWSEELIGLMAREPRICKHAHVPLQSGSDRILRAMHRKYRPWHYAEHIRKIRAAAPQAAIGADVMVGFPGETDELFEESRRFIDGLPFTYLHVFTFSARPGTPAAKMPDQVPVNIARERNRILRDLAAEKNRAFRQSLQGQEIEAITLHPREDGRTEALTTNYLKLQLSGVLPANHRVTARIDGLNADGLFGAAV
ncbi:MAG: tRNA (N(6)-L-threonylcarbamoyladenosine(37)-C(2))-methylthiotransferase MtaB [Acidobacteriales bacterium]|nr:tRNA (N(6)-L-threonylcarbamoyladenosine(37)-C(2))-methylthiotransferase MtaB [Terriglobales bacterium]